MSELTKIKLGKRLRCIEAMVVADYDHVWDCCCDHGLLGFQLLHNNKAPQVHFVDIVPPLLTDIENKLTQFYQGKERWHVHCLDVSRLPIQQYNNQSHLIIMAGVGGELLIELMKNLLLLTRNMHVEFLLSPVHHNYQLRHFLNENDCGLIDECIVEENERFYEVLHISKDKGELISLVGSKMWDFTDQRHQVYHQKIISHYQRVAKNPLVDVSEIIKSYQDIMPCV